MRSKAGCYWTPSEAGYLVECHWVVYFSVRGVKFGGLVAFVQYYCKLPTAALPQAIAKRASIFLRYCIILFVLFTLAASLISFSQARKLFFQIPF